MHERYAIQQLISHSPTTHPAIFADDCNCTFNYEAGGDGLDWTAQYDTASAHSCLYGILVMTRNTGATADDRASIWKYLPLNPNNMYTLQFIWSFTHSYGSLFEAEVRTYMDNSDFYSAALRFRQAELDVQYRGPGYAWFTIPGLSINGTGRHWNHVLMSFSRRPPYWHLIVVNNNLVSPDALPLYRGAHVACQRTRLQFSAETQTNLRRGFRLDQIKLMPNTP